MDKLFVVHYLPIDYYPPVLNLINTLEDKIIIFVSTMRKSNVLSELKYKKAKIYHIIHENKSDSSLKILLKYFLFSLFSLIYLIQKKPDVVLYYESVSAFPVYLYKRFFNKSVKLCIHYHEYMTPAEYNLPGRRLAKFNHRLETSYLFRVACWISHTNEYRRKFFMRDYSNVSKTVCNLLPNYPPQKWLCKYKKHIGDVIRCVYVGSLSLESTYVLEFCQWVVDQKGKVSFDIYSFNFHADTLLAIENLKCPYIRFHNKGIKYSDIPSVFEHFDVGVLLYKAYTLNFKYNETNKLYEYLICGLDVWYPKEMILLHEMDKSVYVPQIIEMDITHGLFPLVTITPETIDNSSYDKFCEGVYESFMQSINK